MALRMVLDARDDVGEVGEGVDAAGLAGGDEGIEAGDAHPGLDVANEEEVLPAESDPPERALGRVVVERYACVVEKAAELAPLLERVVDRRRDWALRRVPRLLVKEPRVQALAHGAGPVSSETQVLGRADDLLGPCVVLDTVEGEDEIDRLLSDRTLAASMGESGLATARGHGTDALAEATLDTYETVLGRAPLGVP